MMEYHGRRLRLRLEGESHSPEMRVTIWGLPVGEPVDKETLLGLLARRRPGQSPLTTGRNEKDEPEFLSGTRDGMLTGEPVVIRFANEDRRPEDYAAIRTIPRPGHADYPQYLQGGAIPSGGGALGGRMTLLLCAAGGLALGLLKKKNITVAGRLLSVGGVRDIPLPVWPPKELLEALAEKKLPVWSEELIPRMEEEILAAAKKAKEAGAVRFSLVTSGRNQDNPNEFDEIIDIVKKIREQVGIEVCCSLGLISKEQALQLKEAGITRIHCNIETSPSYFPEICSTHTMEDKEDIIHTAQSAGIRVCSGGIIGLGESLDQRVEMAFHLKEMHIDSVPLNILNPVKGTPFYTNKRLSPLEVLRTFAMFRFVLPKALIRTAGGREVNLRSLQAYALTGGLNGIMVGGYLTTGGRDPKEDIRMTEDLGRSMTTPKL